MRKIASSQRSFEAPGLSLRTLPQTCFCRSLRGRTMRKIATIAFLLALVTASSPIRAQAPGSAPDPKALLAEIDAATLQPEKAVALKKVKLAAGLATLTLEGKLIPVSPAGGQVRELVFFGQGRIELPPPDEVEAGQLELFTGAPAIDESFDQAVFVFGLDRA